MPARAALFAHFQRTSFSVETLRRSGHFSQRRLNGAFARCARAVHEILRPKKGTWGNAGCPLHPQPRVHLAPRRGKRSELGATQTRSSCPDLIRASINLRNKAFSKRMDHRVKPGDDDLKQFS